MGPPGATLGWHEHTFTLDSQKYDKNTNNLSIVNYGALQVQQLDTSLMSTNLESVALRVSSVKLSGRGRAYAHLLIGAHVRSRGKEARAHLGDTEI